MLLLEKHYRWAFVNGHPNLAEYIRIAVPEPKIPTAATDGVDIFYNPDFIAGLSVKDAVGVFMHEYYHIIYEHVRRRGNRHPVAWNLCADVVVNDSVITRCGFTLPEGSVMRGQGMFKDLPAEANTSTKIYDWLKQQGMFKDLPAEANTSTKIYDWLKQQANQNLQEAGGLGSDLLEEPEGGDSQANQKAEGPAEAKASARHCQMPTLGDRASQNEPLKQAGQLAADKTEEMREAIGTSAGADWIDLVKAVQIESGRLVHRTHQRSFLRPARYEPQGLLRPCNKRYQHHPKVDVYIDVSGSMGDQPLQIFTGLKSILSALRIYRPSFYAFNTDIFPVSLKSEKFNLGGGTDIRKVLHKVNADKADLAVVITDCEDSVSPSDFKSNVICVSNNATFADYYTQDWLKVRRKV